MTLALRSKITKQIICQIVFNVNTRRLITDILFADFSPSPKSCEKLNSFSHFSRSSNAAFITPASLNTFDVKYRRRTN